MTIRMIVMVTLVFSILTAFFGSAYAQGPSTVQTSANVEPPATTAEAEQQEELTTQPPNTTKEDVGPTAQPFVSSKVNSGEKSGEPKVPVDILRFLIFPVIIWIAANLVNYSIKRMHLARILYVDTAYRLRFAARSVITLQKWLREFETQRRPLLRSPIMQEKHEVYPSIQDALVSATWGQEIPAVRIYYRDFQEIEERAGKIAEIYGNFCSSFQRQPPSDDQKSISGAHIINRRRLATANAMDVRLCYDEIHHHVCRIRAIVLRWLMITKGVKRTGKKLSITKNKLSLRAFLDQPTVTKGTIPFEEPNSPARRMLYGKWAFHFWFVFLPLAILIALAALYLWPPVWMGIALKVASSLAGWIEHPAALVSAVILLFALYVLVLWTIKENVLDRKIYTTVLQRRFRMNRTKSAPK